MRLTHLLLLFTCLLASRTIMAQQTAGTPNSLAVPKYEHDFTIPQLFELLDHSHPDTAKVQLLLKLSSIYHPKKAVGWIAASFSPGRRSNLLLQIKQTAINEQNQALQELITNKDGRLKEKEWLLKEVHQRVKNNLQMMISLINIQSEYLTNAHAVEAVRNSSRRMYSMSLIHQKIYQSENFSSIDMTVNIPELASYLKESFDGKDQISYTIRTVPLDLDIIQAVLLGLILNEGKRN